MSGIDYDTLDRYAVRGMDVCAAAMLVLGTVTALDGRLSDLDTCMLGLKELAASGSYLTARSLVSRYYPDYADKIWPSLP